MCSLILTVVLFKKVEILTSKVDCKINTILFNPSALPGLCLNILLETGLVITNFIL